MNFLTLSLSGSFSESTIRKQVTNYSNSQRLPVWFFLRGRVRSVTLSLKRLQCFVTFWYWAPLKYSYLLAYLFVVMHIRSDATAVYLTGVVRIRPPVILSATTWNFMVNILHFHFSFISTPATNGDCESLNKAKTFLTYLRDQLASFAHTQKAFIVILYC